jgi:hypothetical protein
MQGEIEINARKYVEEVQVKIAISSIWPSYKPRLA